jgi:hypothetical protein
MDEFLEKKTVERGRKLGEKFSAEGGPAYEEGMRAWREWRERHKRPPKGAALRTCKGRRTNDAP